jgi:outer membrane murein-binding lipoprotein Lpp
MKKISILAGALLAVAALQFAAPAVSVPNSNVARRVTVLESKVKALRTSVASAKSDAAAAKARLACITAVGLTRFGDPASQTGYLWGQNGSLFFTTALDLTPDGQTASFYAASIEGSCLTSASPLYSSKASPANRPLNAMRK